MSDYLKTKIENFIGYTIILFPLFMILGSALLNIFSILLGIYCLINGKKLKRLILSGELIYLAIIFLVVVIFPYNSINFEQSLVKYVSNIRYILVFFGIIIYLDTIDSYKFFNKIKKIYLILLIIISIDVLKEYLTGTNLLGFNTSYTGRIASFTNDELIIGYIFSFLALFSFGIINTKIKNFYLILFFYFIIIISFLIGERSNFLKLFSIIIVFSIFHQYLIKKFKIIKLLKFAFLIVILGISFFIFTKNTDQAKKLYNNKTSIFTNKIENFSLADRFYNSHHAPHYVTAVRIFLNYPIFGIGINNFQEESKKNKYHNNKLKYSKNRSSTHPHQIYLEILAEVGLIGFIYYFLIFFYPFYLGIKFYLKNKNINLLSHLMLHIFFIYPILPSGSFFGTIYGMPFWFNLSFLVYLTKQTEIKRLFKKIS